MPLTRSKTQAGASHGPHAPTARPLTQAGQSAWAGMPFRKMYETREQVRQATYELNRLTAIFADAQKDHNCTQAELESQEAALRFKSAELKNLLKKLEPMEANFQKSGHVEKRIAQSTLESQAKKRKLDHRLGEMRQAPPKIAPTVQVLMPNTATLDVPLPSGGCHLTPNECQYNHLERLRRQYARPFEIFCEEMDTISDTCLTGICLALPDMPWSIALSRLAFLFKPNLDSHNNHPASSDTNYRSAGTIIGCGKHMLYITLAEVMVIQDWRDFMRWAHHQSHVFNLCGRRSCIKLKHMCLEPIDCMTSRKKCRTDSDALHGKIHNDQPTNQATSKTPLMCSSPGCWPPCLPRHKEYSLLHSVAVEFSAFHHVSFGPLTSVTKKELYTPINQHQLRKLVHDEEVGLILPFQKSYGHIFVDQWQDDSFSFHPVDTLLPIPAMYTSEEAQPLLERLPTWTELSFNVILDSIFWYARKRSMPFLASEMTRRVWGSTHFDHRSPRYQCPFCHGFDNFFDPVDSLVETIIDYGDLNQALQHMLFAHTRVPLTRKVKFLLEEMQKLPSIGDAWKAILRDDYDASVAILATGAIPRAVADLCGDGRLVDPMSTAVSSSSMVDKREEHVAAKVEVGDEKE
ncbi:hypothetical protein F4859DRAFT_336221 [Xylaria cf. heliscus]|nr:hypothetical protein F4859DRAFT_336221 [Xylaria cf. heliscus]